ncbi:CpsD/CapB family tyrosine-protein kinase [Paenilisteria rocourtiae]|uniref:non-specific protein-tyrosine kinase n=1 Tax=Listeria rocourtiae TaxID=647910 RepID=A0A4R6ZFA9_9LIST|nr:CpsD/CapB family tyrosine-protein kinase [Listeria rocourtiae]EUJ44668.1 non-specific protein-tyrosine kinase [Listeria rocourtiae FSL F6-920]MBC1606000.1 CpsD/CapB family tyrosine-protein kinase [Listeria rocourtiae]TDR50564.1 capsular exopolysaccharide synthesis family protein [Listeria rocourtiae]
MKTYRDFEQSKEIQFYKEKFQSIQTSLQFMLQKQGIRNFMVTSANMSEGKSFMSANIACIFAEKGNKTLLIDADFHRPSLRKYMQISENIGLIDRLMGEKTLMECTQETHQPNLRLMPTGIAPLNPSEWVDSLEMKQLIEEAKQQFDYVIIDAPPLLPITDSRILSSLCDGVLFVTFAKRTKRSDIKQAMRYLDISDAHVIGSVVNGVPASKNDMKGYHYKY